MQEGFYYGLDEQLGTMNYGIVGEGWQKSVCHTCTFNWNFMKVSISFPKIVHEYAINTKRKPKNDVCIDGDGNCHW